MNKVILGLILAVCLLGMALVMLDERLERTPENQPVASLEQAANSVLAPAQNEITIPATPPREQPEPAPVQPSRQEAIELERQEAREALAPPVAAKEQTPAEPPVNAVQTPPVIQPAPVNAAPERENTPPAKPPAPQPKPETVRTDPKPAAPQGNKNITRFVVFAREKGATVRISGNSALNYKSMTLENPDRIVLDLPGEWNFPSTQGIPRNELVTNVRVGKLGDNTRVVIDLREKPRLARVIPSQKGDSVDIRVDR